MAHNNAWHSDARKRPSFLHDRHRARAGARERYDRGVDWRFLLSESCIDLARHYCFRRKQHFTSIAYYAPITIDEGKLWPLYPVDPASLLPIDEASMRNNVVTNGNPAMVIATPDGMGA